MLRDEALQALIPYVEDSDIVVAVYQTCFDWLVLNPRDLNYVSVGAMGQASSHGLGLALANPKKRVMVFDGDGSLLMNLGSLVTISAAKPSNLYHFVFVNRIYEVNEGHPLPAAEKIDFAAMARAAGYADAQGHSSLDAFRLALPEFLSAPGPRMVVLEVTAGKSYPRNYDYIHSAAARETFRKALNQY
jgi:sulfopyruvate decarboxylase subunit beta